MGDEAASLLQAVYDDLVANRLLAASTAAAEDNADEDVSVAAASEGAGARDGLSSKRFEAIFSKELKKRNRAAGPHCVSAEALACVHSWDNTGTGGLPCQVCAFETKDRSWTCNLDCGVQLCGGCMYTWKTRGDLRLMVLGSLASSVRAAYA